MRNLPEARRRLISAYCFSRAGVPASERAKELASHAVARGFVPPRAPPPGATLDAWSRRRGSPPAWACLAAYELATGAGYTPRDDEETAIFRWAAERIEGKQG